jgi:hypothetical protein
MPRRTRKLPSISTKHSADPDFTISDVDWQRIETAYGEQLSESVRTAILHAMRTFVSLERLEHSGPPIAHAERAIQRCKDAAEKFRDLMLTPGSNAEVCARYLILKNFGNAPRGADALDTGLTALTGFLTSFKSACDNALADLKAPIGLMAEVGELPSIVEGTAWRRWIVELTGIIKGTGLPYKVRKDAGGKSRDDKLSQFVLLVFELQNCLPCCSMHSKPALAGNISRARRSWRASFTPIKIANLLLSRS